MSIFYIKNNQLNGEKAVVLGEDVKHIKDVLRYNIGDEISLCDEEGYKYNGKILSFSKDSVEVNILEKLETTSESKLNITLYQGLPKADKLEFIIQKCTELGVNEVVPVITDRVIVKLDEKSTPKKVERWNKIALEAAKQSGRQKVPVVQNPIKLKNSIENISKYDIVILPYECEKEVTLKKILKSLDKGLKNIAIVIGPEGGFSEEDLKVLDLPNVKKVTLGPRILRTETAGLATISATIYELED